MSANQQSQRKIAVITGTRAEYGLLKSLLQEIQQDCALLLQLIVTGMHLSPEFGLTYREIEQDGFNIDAKIETLLSSDTAMGIAKSVGVGILGFSDTFDRLKPNIIVVLGDRFEILAAAQTAMLMKIPIAHIHGGELTQGAIDDSIRHAMTKMSHLHFTATEQYRQRVIRLGESPACVFNYGSLGVERIKKSTLLNKSQLEIALKTKFSHPTFLVTYHPATLVLEKIENEIQILFSALDAFLDAHILFTSANADETGRFINQQINLYCKRNSHRAKAFTNLGDLNYLSAVSNCDIVIGNSSSGIIEAPALYTPSINIGDRQKGRLLATSVIQCKISTADITNAIKKALSSEFKNIVKHTISPYHAGETAFLLKEKIKTTDLTGITKKEFYDLQIHGHEQLAHNNYC